MDTEQEAQAVLTVDVTTRNSKGKSRQPAAHDSQTELKKPPTRELTGRSLLLRSPVAAFVFAVVGGAVPWEWPLPYCVACRTLFFDNLVLTVLWTSKLGRDHRHLCLQWGRT